jgi:hypothetical protein
VNFDELMSARMASRYAGRTHIDIPCPICSPTRRKSRLRVMRTWSKSDDFVSFNCVHCGTKGYATSNAPAAKPRSSDMQRARARAEEIEERETQARIDRARTIWEQGIPLQGTPGETWLREVRCIDPSDGEAALRFHPECPYDVGALPCIIGRYVDAVTGEPRGIRRRPIVDGHKAITLGPMGGCVIRLSPQAGDHLYIAEGVETALFAASRMSFLGVPPVPMWAAGSAGNIERLPVIPGVKTLTILADNDLSGQGLAAARKCRERWVGRNVAIVVPEKPGTDFNDIANG